MTGFLRKLGVVPLVCPVARRGQKGDAITPLSIIGQAMGFGDERSQRLLQHHHDRRLRRYRIINRMIMLVFVAMLLFSGEDLPVSWPGEGGDRPGDAVTRGLVYALFLAGEYGFYFLLVGITLRLAQVLIDRYFAESLCATHAMYLLVELQHEDVLSRADRRIELVRRFDALARTTRLLALRYGPADPERRLRVQHHFREMAGYIAERRTWAVTPLASTLEDLKRDVRELVRIFTLGTYGEFRWVTETADPEPALRGWKPLLRGIGKTAGLLAPTAAMMYLLGHPQQLQALGFSSETVGMLLAAWVFLTLDSMFQFGVVSGLVGLARGIKELR
ncbi:MAG TPA: hypothetical protein VEQ60_24870 [Longimicrobium sp.]|nr:hypothetical protein [Longimicrobium sp.]